MQFIISELRTGEDHWIVALTSFRTWAITHSVSARMWPLPGGLKPSGVGLGWVGLGSSPSHGEHSPSPAEHSSAVRTSLFSA